MSEGRSAPLRTSPPPMTITNLQYGRQFGWRFLRRVSGNHRTRFLRESCAAQNPVRRGRVKPARNSHGWRYNALASNKEVEQVPDERCPDCGSGFAEDRKSSGFRRHLEQLPKRDRITKEIIKDTKGNPFMCGGTSQSWGKGNRS